MKVLWLSNSAFVSEKTKATGSWVQPMAEQLALFILLVDSELDMLRIYEEESMMSEVERRITEQF